MSVLAGVGSVFLGWVSLAALLVGLGSLLALALVGRGSGPARPFDLLWLGLAALVGGLQIWHLFLPVDRSSALVFGACGVAGLLIGARTGVLALDRPRATIGLLLLAAPILILIADNALDAPVNFDSGMYHFQQIRWNNEHPIVLGLGNLNFQLGLNQSYFLVPALLNHLPPFARGFHLANSFLLAALALNSLAALADVIRSRRRLSPSVVLSVLMLPVALTLVGHFDLHSPAPDFAVALLSFVAFVRFCELSLGAGPAAPHSRTGVVALTVLLATLVTLKSSSVAFAGLVLVCLAVGPWRASMRSGTPGAKRRLAAAAVAVGLLLAPWATRGLLTTGYPLFPSTLGGAPIEWRVPRPQATYVGFFLRYHPRVLEAGQGWGEALVTGYREISMEPRRSQRATISSLTEATSSGAWLRPWMRRVWKDPGVRAPVIILVPGLLLALSGALRRRSVGFGREWYPLVPLALSLVFWFVTAPEPRFALWLFWLVALWSWAIALDVWCSDWQPRRASAALAFVVVAAGAIALVLAPPGWIVPEDPGGFRAVPEARLKPFRTRSGLELWRPVGDRRVWDALLPATPHPSYGLRLRRPERGLAGGFVQERDAAVASGGD